MTRTAAILPPALLAAALAAVLLVQRQTASQWRHVTVDLRAQNREVPFLRQQNGQFALWAVSPSDLAALRRDAATLAAEQRRLDAMKRRLAFETRARMANAPPAPLAPGLVPIAAMTNAGTSTPEAAARTFFWNVGRVEPDAIAHNLEFAPDAQAKADAAFSRLDAASRKKIGTPEKLVALLMVEMLSRATGVQVQGCNYDPQTAGRAVWNAKLQTASGRLHDISFPIHQTPSGWHEVITTAWLDRWSSYLR